jgi:hypothetical protein
MKLSELISILTETQKKEGDLIVTIEDREYSLLFDLGCSVEKPGNNCMQLAGSLKERYAHEDIEKVVVIS